MSKGLTYIDGLGLFARWRAKKDAVARKAADMALEAAEARRDQDAESAMSLANEITAKLDKLAKRQNKTELICEDILQTLNSSAICVDGASSDAAIPAGLFCDVLEAYDRLSKFCRASTDSQLASQSPHLDSKVKEALEKHGFERIDQTGVPVDIKRHEIYSVVPAPDEKSGGTVKQVIIAGCASGQQVARRALIIAYGGWSE